ncbi:MAG: thioredoxin domain-containing protein [Candidatus ainarchaeum sp.]|nr:thioredoxin domain-containing protein [Candidatus ainarchaeum sp.]
MVVKKKSKVVKKVEKKTEKPVKKIDTKTAETVEEPKKCCKSCDCSKLKQIFTNQYFILGLIIVIIVVIGLAFAFGNKEVKPTDDNNTEIVSDKVIFTLYGDYLSPSTAAFYDLNYKSLVAKYPGVDIKFELYGGIESSKSLGGFDFKEGKNAKIAELCAKDQGKEKEMIDLLLTNANKDHNGATSVGYYSSKYYYLQQLPGIYTDEKINSYVTQLGLDKTKFDACYKSEDKKNMVDSQFQTIALNGFMSLDPMFVYDGEKFALDIIDSVVQNVNLGKPIKPAMTVKIIGKVGLDYFEQQNVNPFEVFDYYYSITDEIVDADSVAGKKLISDLGIEMLPAYVFEGQITESPFYENIAPYIDTDNNVLGLYKTQTMAAVGIQGYYYLVDLADFAKNLSQDYSIGSKDAKVTIIEFSDYQCPWCREFNKNNYGKLKNEYIDAGKVNFYYLQHPIADLHPTAHLASLAAMCAAEQGKYWQYHEKIFITTEEGYDANVVKDVAQQVGLDLTKFDTCYNGTTYNLELTNIADFASNLGLNGTPAFIVGNAIVGGYVDYSAFKKVVDYELSQSK